MECADELMLTSASKEVLPVVRLDGQNVGGVPLSTDPEGFWILVALVATFTLIAGRWAFRKRKDY